MAPNSCYIDRLDKPLITHHSDNINMNITSNLSWQIDLNNDILSTTSQYKVMFQLHSDPPFFQNTSGQWLPSVGFLIYRSPCSPSTTPVTTSSSLPPTIIVQTTSSQTSFVPTRTSLSLPLSSPVAPTTSSYLSSFTSSVSTKSTFSFPSTSSITSLASTSTSTSTSSLETSITSIATISIDYSNLTLTTSIHPPSSSPSAALSSSTSTSSSATNGTASKVGIGLGVSLGLLLLVGFITLALRTIRRRGVTLQLNRRSGDSWFSLASWWSRASWINRRMNASPVELEAVEIRRVELRERSSRSDGLSGGRFELRREGNWI